MLTHMCVWCVLAGQKRVAPSKLSRRPLQVTNAIPLKVMISGAPAAGKGTQCEKIVDRVS